MNHFVRQATTCVIAFGMLGAIVWNMAPREAMAASATDNNDLYSERQMGNPNAPVKIVEYFSLTCPHCSKFEQETLPRLKTDYVDTGKVLFISRDFPFDRPGLEAAQMARCVPPDRYFGLIDLLFKDQEQWALATDPLAALKPLGKFAGLSDKDLNSCFDNKELETFIVNGRKVGTEKYKVDSTPTFILNDGADKINGAETYDKFKSSIDALLAKK